MFHYSIPKMSDIKDDRTVSDESILTENKKRFVLFPIKYPKNMASV